MQNQVAEMNSRERILKSLNHEEPDQVPFDLAGSTWTGITNTAYQNLRKYKGLSTSIPDWSDVIQQIVIPSAEILNELNVDTRGVFPLTSHNWDVHSKLKDVGDYFEYYDEWGFTHHFPKNGYWFSLVKHPMDAVDFESDEVIENCVWQATGMEPFQLKKDFGKELVFWGGGIDTQKVLPSGTLNEVMADIKRNIDALAPGGGFVFSTVHNIQAEVPPQNIIAMLEAL